MAGGQVYAVFHQCGLIQVAAFTLMETVFHLPYWPSLSDRAGAERAVELHLQPPLYLRSDASVGRSMLLVALFYAVFTPVSTWGATS